MPSLTESEVTQSINYLDCATLSMRLPEPPEESAGHRAPGTARRLRETARRALLGIRRRIVGVWDRVWPPMVGVLTGLTIWSLMLWALLDALIS